MTTLILKQLLNENKKCRGIIVRAKKTCARKKVYGKYRYEMSIRLETIKEYSCRGCKECVGIYEYLEYSKPDELIGIESVVDKGKYKIVLHEMHHDFETGEPDDFQLGLERI